jgi:hypothetical protein
MDATVKWLLESGEPWTRYRTLLDLLGCSEKNPAVQEARARMLAHPKVIALIEATAAWGERSLKRHNDASHPLYALSTLADFGVGANDLGMMDIIEKVKAHISPDGPFQTLVFIPEAFGGPNEDIWTWVACDAPTLLYTLLGFGLGDDPQVQRAVEHLVGLAEENGYRCTVAAELGRFKGPGKRADPCPIANVYALKALSLAPEQCSSQVAHLAAEMLLGHWERQRENKYYLFGVGTDFRKLKYPFVWYDILHVTEVLSRFSFALSDPRFHEMVDTIKAQANSEERYTAASMYMSWKGWSFADKKAPSPWLTYLVHRILKRTGDCLWAPPVEGHE